MMRLSRLVLAAGFTVALAAPGARAAEPDKLLPADSDSVTFVNVKQILGSEVVKKYALEQIKQALAGQDAKQFLEQLGLDPLKDIDKVWAGSSGKDLSDMKGLAIVHGKFDPEKLFKAAEGLTKKEADKFSLIKDGGTTILKFQPDQGNPVYGTVVDDTTVIVGTDKKLITTAIKQAADQKAAPIPADLAALVKKMDDKASVFTTSIVKGKLDNVKVPPQLPIDLSGVEKALPKTETMSLILRVSGDINMEFLFGMKDDDAATDMGDAMTKAIDGIKGLITVAAAAEPKAKPLVDVVKTIKSDVKKKDVIITAKVAGDLIGKAINAGD
ncbi:hypothetical protein [Frigoriglobus tundricola]|uniref:DUF3352 domain-containing protein n=1 Tax=Frigoriglobus tundricola TaxID=2774151 RepID=A0A6M5YJX6_9BACT|nr:hypothetical protein [Frigoriglobus tundricola]QJW94288.1 hypothetical protein FTUN_1808 [Frigoriglobus tundricola]